MKANLKMNRRLVLSAAAVAPVAALPALAGPESDIQILFRRWKALTEEYLAIDKNWNEGELSDGDFEDAVGPILARRDSIEQELLPMDCTSINDLAAKVEIAEYFDWMVDDMNMAIGLSAKAMVA